MAFLSIILMLVVSSSAKIYTHYESASCLTCLDADTSTNVCTCQSEDGEDDTTTTICCPRFSTHFSCL
jgi:hypothetical protein